METFVQSGNAIPLTAPGGGVTSGTGVMVGAIFAVPAFTAAAGEKFTGIVRGVVEHAKVSAQAWTEGQRLYWNAGLSQVTSVATDGPFIGLAAEAAANPSATGKVLLAGPAPEFAEGQQAAVADLVMTVGAADGTIADVGAAFNQATLNNNFRDVGEKINALAAALRAAGIIAP